jgi:hypothetical protein
VNTCRGKFVDETSPYLENLVKYLWIHLKINLSEIAADFIKDESGIWWLVNVKYFRLMEDEIGKEIFPKAITSPSEYEIEVQDQ